MLNVDTWKLEWNTPLSGKPLSAELDPWDVTSLLSVDPLVLILYYPP